jgi:hypothetical protein
VAGVLGPLLQAIKNVKALKTITLRFMGFPLGLILIFNQDTPIKKNMPKY